MKINRFIISIFVFLIPTISFGQLFPSVPDFNGDIEKVVEKTYGRDVYIFKKMLFKLMYLPGIYSGWKYVYQFDSEGRLERRINLDNGDLRAEYIYEYDSTDEVIREREIINDDVNDHKGNYSEEEYILDSEGKLVKAIHWSFNLTDSVKRMVWVGKDIQYDSLNNITSFSTQSYDFKGEEIPERLLYVIRYDSLSRVIEFEENAIDEKTIIVESEGVGAFKSVPIDEPELMEKKTFKYNSKGQIVSFTIKYFGEVHKMSSTIGADYSVYFKYDKNGNWIKMYYQYADSKKRLQSKRRIIYR